MRITFEELQVHNPPADELGRHNPGPIFGKFRVFSGVREETLGYDASHCWGAWIFEQCVGLKLERRNYSIMDDLFDWVYRWRDRCRGGPGCPTPHFHVPDIDMITLEVGGSDDIRFGGWIRDSDANDEDDILFKGYETRNVGDLDEWVSLVLPVHGDYADLIVRIDLLPMP